MQSEIVSADQTPQTRLGDRLDESIGEASSGIGVLLSELVRRSLKTGVSDIGESLVEFAEEQVEVAVQQQMPGLTETADAVAQSTSRRVVQDAVDTLNVQSAKQQEFLEAKIDVAESSAFDRSRNHVHEVLNEVHESINQTKDLAVESNESSQRRIEELREKARQSWRKLRDEFATVHDAHEQLRKDHQNLTEKLSQVHNHHRQQVEVVEQKFSEMLQLSQRLEERIAFLEQPRGIKGMFAKFRGRNKSGSEPDQAADDPGTSEPTDAVE